jgi:hypothetical protein
MTYENNFPRYHWHMRRVLNTLVYSDRYIRRSARPAIIPSVWTPRQYSLDTHTHTLTSAQLTPDIPQQHAGIRTRPRSDNGPSRRLSRTSTSHLRHVFASSLAWYRHLGIRPSASRYPSRATRLYGRDKRKPVTHCRFSDGRTSRDQRSAIYLLAVLCTVPVNICDQHKLWFRSVRRHRCCLRHASLIAVFLTQRERQA